MANTVGSLVVFVGVVFAALYPVVFSNSVVLLPPSAAYEGGALTIVGTSSIMITGVIRWTINDVAILDLPDITHDQSITNMLVASLSIMNISADLNGAIVGCTVILNDVNATCSSPQAIQVQGILGPVLNLGSQYDDTDRTLNVSWIPPTAIAVPPATRPEIFYCVQISNGPSIGCNRTGDMNENTSIVLRDVVCGNNYDITVTPFNRLGGQAAMTEEFPDTPVISDRVTVPQLNGNSFTYTYGVSGLVCNCSAVILDTSIEGSLQCDLNTPGSLTITTVNVAPNRRFDVQLLSNNSRRFRAKESEISTFDSDLTVSSIDSTVEYLLTFVGGSNARGVFMALVFKDGQSVNLGQSIYFVQGTSGAQMTNRLMELSPGNYEVLAYDIEGNGEITSDTAAGQQSVTVTGSSTSTPPLQTLSDITCNSTEDSITVSVMCDFNTTMYSGYRVYIQDTSSSVMLRFVESTTTGEMVSINGSLGGGQHLVMVYPIWNSEIPDGRFAPTLRVTYNLAASIATTIPPTSQATTVPPVDSSSTSPSPDPTTSAPPIVPGPSGPFQDMGTVIGVVVAIVAVSVVVAVLIVFVVIILLKWNKRRKVASFEELVLSERDGQRSPSSDKEIAAYASAGPPPKKSTSGPVKTNGSDAPPPPSETAPTPSGGATALYSSVDLNQKRKEREAKNGSIKENKKGNSAEATPALVEPANLYASVDDIQKNKTVQAEERAQEQAHQEPQYETVQLKLKKPTQEKVEDEHLVEYASIDHLKKAAPEPKKEEPPKKESVETPHVQEKK